MNTRIAVVAFLAAIGCIAFGGRVGGDFESVADMQFDPFVFAQESEGLHPELAGLVRAVADAQNAKDASKALDKLFKAADRKKVQRLKQVEENGVALRAAWEELQQSGMKDKTDFVDMNPDPVAVSRFLGFVEGRLGLSMPAWWESSVKNAYYETSKRLWSKIDEFPYHQVEYGSKNTIWLPENTIVKQKGEGLAISVDKESFLLSASQVQKFLHSKRQASLCLTDDRCLLATHRDMGEAFPLFCLDRQTGQKMWENTVWNGARVVRGGSSLPPTCQLVDIRSRDKQVYVVAAGFFGWFIEAFDLKTGRATFRFGTSYYID